MNRYIKIWWMLAVSAFQDAFSSRLSVVILVVGKLLRFALFFFFLVLIGAKTKLIAGYSLNHIIFFFFTYQLLDTLPQLFLREVYRFRSYVVSGDFDYFLVKPISPLFRALFGGSDVLDIPMTIISVIALIITAMHIGNISVEILDRKSTRLNSSHQIISYAVFCLKKKNKALKQLHDVISVQ